MVQRLLASLACCCLLALAGCSDDSSSSASPGPSPTLSSSEVSPSPTETDSETPEEFVRRWVDVDREMQNSGDTGEYRRITRGCHACDGVADQVEKIYSAGGYVKTHGLVIRSVEAGDPDSNGEVEVRLKVRSTPTEYVEEEGGSLQRLPGGLVTYLLTLQARSDSWGLTLLERMAT